MVVAGVLTAWLGACTSTSEPPPTPPEASKSCGHAHNDYEHPRPLLDALGHGFCSVEADVHLVGGALLVAHDADEVVAGRTLERLYLEPLRARSDQLPPDFVLMVDVKSDGEATYPVLHAALEAHADILTVYRGGVASPGPVTVVVSGRRAPDLMRAQDVRYAALDGRVPDLDANMEVTLMPWISANWFDHFTWIGFTDFPEDQRARLKEIVRRTHAQNRRLRFWRTMDRADVWQELVAAEVDLINSDDLAGLAEFLGPKPP